MPYERSVGVVSSCSVKGDHVAVHLVATQSGPHATDEISVEIKMSLPGDGFSTSEMEMSVLTEASDFLRELSYRVCTEDDKA